MHGGSADGNAGELVDNEMRQHIKNRRDLHGKGCLPSLLHSPVYLGCGIVGQVKILDLGDALYIFQHIGDKPLVGVELPLGKGLLRPLPELPPVTMTTLLFSPAMIFLLKMLIWLEYTALHGGCLY